MDWKDFNPERFDPWVPVRELALLNRERQQYPLDIPYGLKGYKERLMHSPLSYWQVKARPEDPDSVFVWGHSALMLVCGGTWTPMTQKQREDLDWTAEKNITYSENVVSDIIYEPEPWISNKSSTGALTIAMLRAGFTKDEIRSTFARFEGAGGAYWKWLESWGQRGEDIQQQWLDSGIDQNTGEIIAADSPCTVFSFDPWVSPFKKKLDLTEAPKHLNDQTGRETVIHPETVKAILRVIEAQTVSTGGSAYALEDGTPVSTIPDLLASGKFAYLGRYVKGALREGYIPHMIESGQLVAHTTGIVKPSGGRGKRPQLAFTLASVPETPASSPSLVAGDPNIQQFFDNF